MSTNDVTSSCSAGTENSASWSSAGVTFAPKNATVASERPTPAPIAGRSKDWSSVSTCTARRSRFRSRASRRTRSATRSSRSGQMGTSFGRGGATRRSRARASARSGTTPSSSLSSNRPDEFFPKGEGVCGRLVSGGFVELLTADFLGERLTELPDRSGIGRRGPCTRPSLPETLIMAGIPPRRAYPRSLLRLRQHGRAARELGRQALLRDMEPPSYPADYVSLPWSPTPRRRDETTQSTFRLARSTQ